MLEYAVLACQGGEIIAGNLPAWFNERGGCMLMTASDAGSLKDSRSLGMAELPMTLDYQATLARF